MEALMDVLARFWNKVEKSEGCWLWTASKVDGYGRFRAYGALVLAHRFSYMLVNGPIPDDMLVRHTCDTPACVRPDHLLLGDHDANKADAVRRGRHRWPTGEGHPRAKLTIDDVGRIRARRREGESLVSIARDFPVTASTVSRIARGDYWTEA